MVNYRYDPLYRLTGADASGVYTYSFGYGYDGVGNRTTQTRTLTTTQVIAYVYDNANRLTNAGGQAYSWDANGNLLNDGTSVSAYDQANRLKTLTQTATVYSFAYNGAGDRLKQIIAGTLTTYTLDVNSGLAQVMADGGNRYVYGNSRVAQYAGATASYFLVDGLGSVRQLADNTGLVTLAERYDPFGGPLSSAGSGTSEFGFTGAQTDATGLEYLRARYYAPGQGRFTTEDSWSGDQNRPMSFNGWLYVYANPVMSVDPSGHDLLYGIEISDGPQDYQKWSIREKSLIMDTMRSYAAFMGGESIFRYYISPNLSHIYKGWGDIGLFPPWDPPFAGAAYYPNQYLIKLPPNLLQDVSNTIPYPWFLEPFRPSMVPAFNIFDQRVFPTVSKANFPTQEISFKFVLAHEMTHALARNSFIYDSFVEAFWPKSFVCICGIPFLCVVIGSEPESDPSIQRNKPRSSDLGDRWREEVLADAIASYLFAPNLLDRKYDNWITNVLVKRLLR